MNAGQELADVADSYIDNPKYLSMLAAAFYQATDIPPTECVLIVRDVDSGGEGYYFGRLVGWDEQGNPEVRTVEHLGYIRRAIRRFVERVW